jgi:hypothetical protein
MYFSIFIHIQLISLLNLMFFEQFNDKIEQFLT